MSTRSGPREFAEEVGAAARKHANLVRRMAVRVTSAPLWQLEGHELADGTTETPDAEPFTGIGFYSRPPASGNPEAIAVHVGGTGAPLIAATRDEKTRKAMAGDLGTDQTAIYTSGQRVRVTSTQVEIGAGVGHQPTLNGTTYRAAGDALITAMTTVLEAIKVYAVAIKAVADPTNAATPALAAATTTAWLAAVAAFQAGAAGYLTTVTKVK